MNPLKIFLVALAALLVGCATPAQQPDVTHYSAPVIYAAAPVLQPPAPVAKPSGIYLAPAGASAGTIAANPAYVPSPSLGAYVPPVLSVPVYGSLAENGSYYGQPNVNGVPKTVAVGGYYRKDGTHVRGHYRSSPGSNPPPPADVSRLACCRGMILEVSI